MYDLYFSEHRQFEKSVRTKLIYWFRLKITSYTLLYIFCTDRLNFSLRIACNDHSIYMGLSTLPFQYTFFPNKPKNCRALGSRNGELAHIVALPTQLESEIHEWIWIYA